MPPEPEAALFTPTLEVDGAALVLPRFDGFGLANVAPTVLGLLAPGAAEDISLPPLHADVLPREQTESVRRVVLFVADGLGHLQLQREVAAGNAPNLGRLIAGQTPAGPRATYAPITSVFPSTTVAALGSLNAATAPSGHGLLSYTLWLREMGTLAEMIRWGPLLRKGSFADTVLGGHAPEAFFWAETVFQRLARHDVRQAYSVNPSYFRGTSLTRMLQQGARAAWYPAPSSVTALVPRILAEGDAGAPTYVYAYWPTVDTVTHVRGPESEEHGAEVAVLDFAFGRLLERIPRTGDTLVLFTADHGHIATSDQQQVSLNACPDLLALLAVPPVGERRAIYLHARPGVTPEALAACARQQLGHAAAVLTRDEAVSAAIFGPGPLPLPDRAAARIGEVLLLPRGHLQLSYTHPDDGTPADLKPPPPPPFKGMHGGLSAEEMLVPLLAVRL